ncbi:MAG TPA: ArsI/CadI family heavy metal resistance metalloenzyme [Thermoanaerobaculia bacterium]|jgi:catechol 2,3-dioxygenase-like lactoylglutathione lyase family enzyme|nr:ArsI/CadI family heavy metal resistance metalloenzyme [Thermoanaerobaculia bacterium]
MSASVQISLNVSDLEKSVAFYRGVFGEPAKLRADYAKFVSADPEIHLALQPGLETAGAHPGPLSHLGIRVASLDEVRRRRAELRSRGIVSEEEKREACCYALQEKFWLSDPDGNRWEVYTVLEDLEHESRAGDRPTRCCAPSAG